MKVSKDLSPALTLRKPRFNPATAALALALPSVLISAQLMAQEDEPIMMGTMQIEERTVDTNPYAEAGAPYKARISGDSRHVKPLAETPQTITVLTQTAIQESGDTDLRAILASQPGISLGTGENGNAFGDRYVIRGHEARSDVFVDGLRDPGMTTRESFAVEQIEVTKGPSSTFAGRGSTGGAINSITKQASTEYGFNKVQAGIGTDNYTRLTLDSNIAISDNAAVRVNLMHSDQDVPDREPADRERTGLALSGALQATDKLKLVADYYYLEAKDTPDLGSYIDSSGKPVKDVPVYLQKEDFLDSDVETFTFRASYEFSDALRLNNATRYGTTENGYVVTGTRGGRTLSTHQGWQEVDYFANMTNLFYDTDIGGKKHQFVATVEYTSHGVINGNYTNPDGSRLGPGASSTPNCGTSYCFSDGNGNYYSDVNNLLQRDITKGAKDSDYNIDTWSFALMDTIDLNDQWSVFLGLRADRFDYKNITGSTNKTTFEYSDTLWNGHAGVVYQMTEEGNFYLTYSTSDNINGGESDVGGNCGYGGICGDSTIIGDSKPEHTENIELGTKWNLFDEKLLVTAAIFQITKDDVMEGADYETTGTLNTGENRVDGFEFSVTGNITEALSVQAGAAIMNAEILSSFNNGVNMGTDRRGNPVLTSDDKGKTLANFADKSAFAQLRYQLTDALSVGGNATYSSEVYVGQPDSAADSRGVPSYTVYDLFATYEFNEQLKARLNIGNVTDKDYWHTAYRSGSFAYIGDRRNAQLSVAYEF